MKKFIGKFLIFANIFAQNIHCGYSNEYPQCMFWIRNKKIRYTSATPSFSISRWGLRGYTFHGHVFLM